MKRTILFLLLSVAFYKLSAQGLKKKNTFGVMAGISTSSITNYDGRLLSGFTGGLYWEWKFSDRFALQSNFLYIQKGEKENGNLSELKLTYINMPMMLKYYGTDKLCFLAGINSDFLLDVASNNLDKNDFKNTDWGIPIGFSYDLSKYFQLGITYNFGLRSIADTNISSEKLRNNFGKSDIDIPFQIKQE